MHLKLILSALEAAKRQLETAIRLYFNSGDPVSIHTLACNAHGLLVRLSEDEPAAPRELENFPMTEDLKARFRTVIGEGRDIVERAERDADGRFEFDLEIAPFFIFDAISNYQVLGGEIGPDFAAFRGWFCAQHMDGFRFVEEDRAYLVQMKSRYSEDRATYFVEMVYAGGGR